MSKRAAGALQARIFAAKLAKADSVISSAQLAAPESASTPIYYPARLYLALLLDCFHGNEELTASRGCGGSGTVSTRLSRPQAESSHRSRWGCSADVHRRVIVPIKLLNGGHCHFKSALGETSALCDKGPNTSLQKSPPITLSSGDSGKKGEKKEASAGVTVPSCRHRGNVWNQNPAETTALTTAALVSRSIRNRFLPQHRSHENTHKCSFFPPLKKIRVLGINEKRTSHHRRWGGNRSAHSLATPSCFHETSDGIRTIRERQLAPHLQLA